MSDPQGVGEVPLGATPCGNLRLRAGTPPPHPIHIGEHRAWVPCRVCRRSLPPALMAPEVGRTWVPWRPDGGARCPQ